MRISIIIESDNLLLSDPGRCRRMLDELRRQIQDLPATLQSIDHRETEIDRPIEVLIVEAHDSDRRAGILSIARSFLPGDTSGDAFVVRPLVTAGQRYFDQKNYGVRESTGDLIVFLDSDVVPEEGWLAALVGSFSDPEVQAVGSNVYVETRDVYSKTMALVWIFDLREPAAGLRPARGLFANSTAFRRSVLERFPYEQAPHSSRGASFALVRSLREAGIPILIQMGAKVAHPPPNGLRHFIRRAIAHGRDHVFRALTESPLHRSGRAIRYATAWTWRGLRRILARHRSVGLPAWQIPLAIAIHLTFYSVAFAGGMLAVAFPDFMARHAHV